MKNVFIALAACVLVTSCAAGQQQELFYKKGSLHAANLQRDLDACKIKSFKEIPQNMVTESTPGSYGPSSTSCFGNPGLVTCNTIPGAYYPGYSNTYDVNAGMRRRFIDQCMVNKGWQIKYASMCTFGQKEFPPGANTNDLSQLQCVDSRNARRLAE